MRLLAALVLLTSAVAHAQPAVPAELVDAGKAITGTWKCKGDFDGTAATGTSKGKLDLDKWWLVESIELKFGSTEGPATPARPPLKVTTYTTYDATAKKWRRVGFDNTGTQMVGTADGTAATAGKTTFNLDLIGPGGAAQLRAYVDASDAKVGVRMWGEQSRDKGKSWKKAYDLTCKR